MGFYSICLIFFLREVKMFFTIMNFGKVLKLCQSFHFKLGTKNISKKRSASRKEVVWLSYGSRKEDNHETTML